MGQSVGSSPRDEPATGATDSDSVPPRTQFVRATETSLRSSADMDDAAMDTPGSMMRTRPILVSGSPFWIGKLWNFREIEEDGYDRLTHIVNETDSYPGRDCCAKRI